MIADQSLNEYLTQLAARASTPGGGAAAGVSGAQGAALLAMVARFTRDETGHMLALATQCDAAVARLLAFSDTDAEGFKAVMAAYAIKASSDEEKRSRQASLQQALQLAAAAPRAMLGVVNELLPIARTLLAQGNPNLVTDVGIGAMELSSCLVACRMNLLVNLKSIEDEGFRQACQAELITLQDGLDVLAAIIAEVEQGLQPR